MTAFPRIANAGVRTIRIMFDISWGEIAVISAVGIALLGRKDLPPASHTLGYHVGRIVGLLRGARVRADRYTADHSLRQLQNEFKSGLRELDAVKAELAGSMMMDSAGAGGGMMGGVIGGGGGLGASVSGVDRIRSSRGASVAARGGGGWEAATQMIDATSTLPPLHAGVTNTFPLLAPRSRSVAAVAEEEWEKRGIGFRSIAEGGGIDNNNNANNDGGLHHHPNNSISTINGGGGGAVILSNYLRQSLIYDQYDRTVREQDEALRTRVEKVRNERNTLDAIAKSSSSSQK